MSIKINNARFRFWLGLKLNVNFYLGLSLFFGVFIWLFACNAAVAQTNAVSQPNAVAHKNNTANNHVLNANQQVVADANLIPVEQWQFSVALGYGAKTNPLSQSDNLPLVLIPSIKYYAEHFYFDNGDLGYTFYDHARFSVGLLTHLNNEFAHFVDWHPSNILPSVVFNSGNSITVSDAELDEITEKTADQDKNYDAQSPPNSVNNVKPYSEIVYADVSKRQWSVDFGLQANWFIDHSQTLRLRLMTELTNRHQGQNVNLDYNRRFYFSSGMRIKLSLGVDWLSHSLVNYYYGVDEKDAVHRDFYYQANSAIQPYIKLNTSYPLSAYLSEHWKLVSLLRYQKLDDAIYLSPIVDQSYRATGFVGINYAF